MKKLKGFDFATYLKRRTLIGQIDPWRKHDNGTPLYCLLVSVEDALAECKQWSGQDDITRTELVKHLQDNHVLVLRSPEHMQQEKEKQHKIDAEENERKKRARHKKELSPERKEELRQRAKGWNSKKAAVTEEV